MAITFEITPEAGDIKVKEDGVLLKHFWYRQEGMGSYEIFDSEIDVPLTTVVSQLAVVHWLFDIDQDLFREDAEE